MSNYDLPLISHLESIKKMICTLSSREKRLLHQHVNCQGGARHPEAVERLRLVLKRQGVTISTYTLARALPYCLPHDRKKHLLSTLCAAFAGGLLAIGTQFAFQPKTLQHTITERPVLTEHWPHQVTLFPIGHLPELESHTNLAPPFDSMTENDSGVVFAPLNTLYFKE